MLKTILPWLFTGSRKPSFEQRFKQFIETKTGHTRELYIGTLRKIIRHIFGRE